MLKMKKMGASKDRGIISKKEKYGYESTTMKRETFDALGLIQEARGLRSRAQTIRVLVREEKRRLNLK